MQLSEIESWDVAALNTISWELSGELHTIEHIVSDLDIVSQLPGWNSPAADEARGTIQSATANILNDAAIIGAVEQLATETAQAVTTIQNELADIRDDIAYYGGDLALSDSGDVTITDPDRVDDLTTIAETLQSRAKAVMRQADDIDADCAEVFTNIAEGDITAAGATTTEGAWQSGRDQSGLSAPYPPEGDGVTPTDVKSWWDALSHEEQQRVITEHPDWIGNRDGVPVVARSEVNIARLDSEITDAQAAVDGLPTLEEYKAENPALNDDDAAYGYANMRRPYDERLARLNGIRGGLSVKDGNNQQVYADDRYLMMFDPDNEREILAAIAIGDPDTADHVSVTTPGMNTHGSSMPDMMNELGAQQTLAENLLDRFEVHEDETVSVIAWLGYDPPDTQDASFLEAGRQLRADEAAPHLADFYRGIVATNEAGADVHLSAFGQSYGSLVTAQALNELGETGIVDEAAFYGSPGLGYSDEWFVDNSGPEPVSVRLHISDESDLFLADGHAFVMQDPDDNVAGAGFSLANAGAHGPNPSDLPFQHLATDAMVTPDGVARDGVDQHADYPRFGADNETLRVTGYNLAAITAGLTHNETDRLAR